MSFDTLLQLVTQHGTSSIIALLVFFIVSVWKRWVILGSSYEELEKKMEEKYSAGEANHVEVEKILSDQLAVMTEERNSWRKVSLTSTNLAESILAVAKTNNGVAPFGAVFPKSNKHDGHETDA